MIGKVIKSDGGDSASQDSKPALGPPRRGGVLNAEEYDAHQTAKQIVADAQKKAEEIKAEALRFKEEVFSKARDEARADIQARSAEEIARAKIQAGQMIQDAEKDILELAIKVAEKIIGSDLARDQDVLVQICANAIQNTRAQKALILRVHPEDGKVLREKRPRLMELIGRTLDLAVRDDADLERGGCIIQTEYGTIDGQIRTQFEMLRNVLIPDGSKKEVK